MTGNTQGRCKPQPPENPASHHPAVNDDDARDVVNKQFVPLPS